MQSDPLQQLRMLHLPPEPTWWPPAIGWWLLLTVILILGSWVAFKVTRHYQAKRPIRHGKLLMKQLNEQFRAGLISEEHFVDESNQIIKRLLVPGLGKQQYAKLSGDQWLEALDSLSKTNHFTSGAGLVLGNERFRPNPKADPDKLNDEVQNLIRQIKP